MPRSIAVVAGVLLAFGGTPAIVAPPAQFGTDWDNPRTAAPPISRPATKSCTTSTPEPSPDGIKWSVEKDVTGYSALLSAPRTVNMYLGNTVDDTYTGVLNVKITLTFYAADRAHPAPGVSQDVLPLADQHTDGQDLAGTVTVPRNTERLVAEVYATGSGGGCEEFWYLTAPSSTGYSCPADPGPYREVQVLLDGRVAGIAAPFPHVYTGGWSNPYLWYVLPAPRAFNIQPITYDLSPFLGRLTDGAAHQVSVHVVDGSQRNGVSIEAGAWSRQPRPRRQHPAAIDGSSRSQTVSSVLCMRFIRLIAEPEVGNRGLKIVVPGRPPGTVERIFG